MVCYKFGGIIPGTCHSVIFNICASFLQGWFCLVYTSNFEDKVVLKFGGCSLLLLSCFVCVLLILKVKVLISIYINLKVKFKFKAPCIHLGKIKTGF